MNKFHLSLYTVACLFALSACGSNDSDKQVSLFSNNIPNIVQSVDKSKTNSNHTNQSSNSTKQSTDKSEENNDQSNNTVAKTEDNTVVANDDAVKADDNTVAVNDDAVKAEDNTVAANDDAVKAEDNTVAANDDAVKTEDNTVVANDDAAKTEDSTVAVNDDAAKAEDNTVAVNDDAVKAEDNTVAASDDAAKAEDNTVAVNDDAVKAEDNTVAVNDDAVKAEDSTVAVNDNIANVENSSDQKNENNQTADKLDIIAKFSEALKTGFKVGKNPNKSNDFGTGKEFTGLMIDINHLTGEISAAETPNSNFESFMINGKQVDLLSADKSTIGVRKWHEDDFPNLDAPEDIDEHNPGWIGGLGDPDGKAYGAYSSVRFGVYTGDDNISHLFVHGKPARSSALYHQDSFEYQGSALFGKDGNYLGFDNALKATADFTNKNIDFDLKVGFDTLKFGGVISGNTFEGTKNNIYTRGGFFGEDASDLGGILNVLDGQYKGYNGAFSAAEVDNW